MSQINEITYDSHEHTRRCWWNPDEAAWVCPSPGTAPLSDGEAPLVDVRDMIVVHTALLRELRLAPAAVGRVVAGDRKQAAVVDAHLRFVCDLLHHHHEGEDELLWPKLRERVPAETLAVLDAVEEQHGDIDASLGRLAADRAAWTATPDAGTRATLVAELVVMHSLLAGHLDFEERAVLPLAATVLTETEWNAVGEAAVAAMPKAALALSFGMFAYEGDPEILRAMLHSAPLVPRWLLPKIAPKLYARRARRVYGTPTP